ncbi:MAG: porin [Pseudomonadota bacterium]|nr:porin [Pseudomonadota bacterium]
MKLSRSAIACALVCATSTSFATDASDVQQLKAQMEALQRQLSAMQQKLDSVTAAQVAAPAVATTAAAAPASGLSTTIGGAVMTLYGFVDVSADAVRGGNEKTQQVSSNLSHVGVRAFKPLGSTGLAAIAQIETLANISGTPTETGGLASRNSFVGLQGSFGKIMLGKNDTPYKRATASMDPFASSVGDYNSIMGNSGGDLRAEFDARLPHAIFYDSPVISGFSVNALLSPGQKLNDLGESDKYALPQGEHVCSGSSPGGSGSTPTPTPGGGAVCDDGAFKSAGSIAANYQVGSLRAILAYELHRAVNRTGDTGGVTSNERALKLGATYNFGTNRLSGIVEKLYRSGGIDPTLNERARNGYYLSDVQSFGAFDLNLAWAHAAQTPGGPDFGTLGDTANLYALGTKYHIDKQFSIYALGSLLRQGPGAHYALGAGGHGVPFASPRDASGATIPGQTLKAVSVGLQYGF